MIRMEYLYLFNGGVLQEIAFAHASMVGEAHPRPGVELA